MASTKRAIAIDDDTVAGLHASKSARTDAPAAASDVVAADVDDAVVDVVVVVAWYGELADARSFVVDPRRLGEHARASFEEMIRAFGPGDGDVVMVGMTDANAAGFDARVFQTGVMTANELETTPVRIKAQIFVMLCDH
jgi:hypothetical protein